VENFLCFNSNEISISLSLRLSLSIFYICVSFSLYLCLTSFFSPVLYVYQSSPFYCPPSLIHLQMRKHNWSSQNLISRINLVSDLRCLKLNGHFKVQGRGIESHLGTRGQFIETNIDRFNNQKCFFNITFILIHP